jgi:competence protein ComEC
MSPSKILVFLCLAFLFGVTTASFKFFLILTIILSALAFFLIYKNILQINAWKPDFQTLILLLIFLALTLLGSFRFFISLPQKTPQRIEYYNGERVTFRGIVSDFPDTRLDAARLTVKAYSILKGNYEWSAIQGKVLIKTGLPSSYRYGDELEIYCDLLNPKDFSGSPKSNYGTFLARYDIYTFCGKPKISLLNQAKGNRLLALLFSLKEKIQETLAKSLSEPHASLLSAMLVGSRGNIPSEILANFSRAGISHILALSGFNITILILGIMVCLRAISLSRKQIFWTAICLIALFVLMVGAEASVVRAGIMGSVVLLARYVGRPNKSFNALIFAATLMVLINPKILAFDLGFQLSFLAMIGLLYLAPVIEQFLGRLLPPLWGLRAMLSTTAAAILFTSPLIMYYFGRFSLIAILANALILPILPLIMLLGGLIIILGSMLPAFGLVLGWITWIFMAYLINVTEFFANLPFASIMLPIPAAALIIFYTLLCVFTWKTYKLCNEK